MDEYFNVNDKFLADGFAIINDIFTQTEIDQLSKVITKTDTSNSTFRKTKDLFAIRQFFKEVPGAVDIIFNTKLNNFLEEIFGRNYFIVKSIYFDKPENSNWFVAYHQDLTISVDKKVDIVNFGPWTVKQNQFAVQPPLNILEDNFTIRIHLDDTTEKNGALKVIPASHRKGIYRPEMIDWQQESEKICPVKRGGVMLMRPLLLHASGRSVNGMRRRVIHVECSRSKLPNEINWSELLRWQN
jgi:ectoine hydroxylase-related dioxygenase (phytanoyl-CoA dioxygenase family)